MVVQASPHKRFQEIAASAAAVRVDREAGIIYGAKAVGTTSRNRRRYPAGVLGKAIPKYERSRIVVNHPKRSEAGEDRPFESTVGESRNVNQGGDGGLYLDMHLKKSHPLFDEICESAERFPNTFGLSHEVEADSHMEGDWEVIDQINAVDCLAIVANPGTTNGIFESVIVYSPGLQQIGGIIDRFVAAAKQLLAIEAKADYRLPQNDLIDTLAAMKARDAELSNPENLSAIDPAREQAIAGVQSHLNKDFADLNVGGAMEDALAALDQLSALAGSNPQPVPANAMQPVGLGAMDFYGTSLHGQPTCESHSDPNYEQKFREAAKRSSSNRK